ncbi:MAG TPA: polyprenol monophosphomannose synthase [Chloroflexia bacterium]|nr:polyprenol monophosphomannose synthase [Chloroflexia bacterium]
MDKCLVVIPTYNEKENIVALIEAIQKQGQEFDVLVVDDNSPDGTGQIVDELVEKSRGDIHVLHRSGKLGLGTAYMDGFRYGLERGYDYLFEMDADFSHKPEYLPQLLAAAKQSGVAAGSRLIAGGGVENWPWYRKLISRGGSLYSRAVLGLKVHDCTGGFKCFSRAALQVLNLPENVRSTGFGFQVEVNCLCEWNGFEITEVPIIFPDRVRGKSKMNQKIFFEALLNVWKLRASRKEHLVSTEGSRRPVFPADGSFESIGSPADAGEWRGNAGY